MFPVAAKKRLLASLLAGALLLCHGVFGTHHLLPNVPVSAHPAHGYHAIVGHEAPERGTDHPTTTGYFATLLAFALGTLFWLLLRNARAWSGVTVPRRHFARPLPPTFFHSPRGPSPPLLRVFRL